MLHTKSAYNSGILNVLVASEEANVIALLLVIADLLNGQLFKKVKLNSKSKKNIDVKQLRSGLWG